MKIKRIAFVTALTLCAATSLTAFASKECTVYNGGVNLTGYISGVEGPFVIQDKVYYQGYLNGPDAKTIPDPKYAYSDSNRTYIIPGTDKKSLGKKYLWKDKVSIKKDNVSCGYGGKKAKIEVYVCGSSNSVSEPLA